MITKLEGFNTQPPEGGWLRLRKHILQRLCGFNTQPPEGGWGRVRVMGIVWQRFQHTAARRRLAYWDFKIAARYRFNTQPPEGGWPILRPREQRAAGFNTQPPEGGWVFIFCPFIKV